MLVRATLAEFDEWKAAFEENHAAREEHGSRGYHLLRDADDPNRVTVLLEFDTLANARRWNDYLEAEDDMDEAGMSDVEITYLELAERRSVDQPTA